MDRELLTTKQVAKLLQLSPGQVRSLVKCGELPAVKLGHRSLRFRRADVEAYLSRHTHGQRSPRVLTVADMFAGLRSPDPETRRAAALLLAYSIGAGLRLAGEHLEDVENIIQPQVVGLLERAAQGDAGAVDVLERHFSAMPPTTVRMPTATPEVPA
jgi:excisionase family DNA binding protein